MYSRDVQFNENEKDSEVVTRDDTDHHLILDFSSDPDSEALTENNNPENSAAEPVLRRSSRERHRPNYYGVQWSHLSAIQSEPKEEATNCPDSSKWIQAMETEMKSLKNNDVWKLVDLPPGKKAIGSKWVYKVKKGADSSTERYKARLVAQGFTQKYGTDYDETFCPVVRQESLRVLIALSIQYGLKLHQVDVTTAFLNGNLWEEVYMKQPQGFFNEGEEHLVCKLKKSIYGLKQSSRCWNTVLDSYLKEIGFTQSTSDPCIYMDARGDTFYIGVYVYIYR